MESRQAAWGLLGASKFIYSPPLHGRGRRCRWTNRRGARMRMNEKSPSMNERVMPMRPLLPPDYRPTEKEPFMNPMQLEYFRQKLLGWRAELLQESTETLQHLQEESLAEPDMADRASLETDRSLEL